MRSAFFMLFAANLAFMAWAGWIDRPAEARVVESATRLPRLWFAGETPGAERSGGSEIGSSGAAQPREPAAQRNGTSPQTRNSAPPANGRPVGASGTTRAPEPARSESRATGGSATGGGANPRSGRTAAPRTTNGAASSSGTTSSAAQREGTPTQLAAALRQALPLNGQSFATAIRPGTGARCLTVGPFKDVARSDRAISLLRDRGFDPLQRTESGSAWAGYWVYVGDLKSEAEQAEVLRKLEAAGIMDAHSMPDTGSGLQVSVGLFSDRGGADRRQRSVERMGLSAAIMEKNQNGTLYWVDLNPDSSRQPVPTEGLIALEESGSRLEMKVCPRGA